MAANQTERAPERERSSTSQIRPKVCASSCAQQDAPELDAERALEARPGEPLDPSQRLPPARPTQPRSEQTPARTPSLPPAIAKLGRYAVLGRLDMGGMAEIYLAREQLEAGACRHAAIKLLRRERDAAVDDSSFEELFLREGRTASQLVHPNICHVYECGRSADDFYIAMEWIDGVSLKNVLVMLGEQGKTMAPSLAAGIAAQVAGALEYAHTARDAWRQPLGVVHLDVSPQNIMLRHDGVVKLVDFGLAQVAEPQAGTRSDLVKGKVGYFAPEQIQGKPLDARVDVFALGVCLFEMLTGRRLYRRADLTASLRAILQEPPPSARGVNPQIPPQLDRIVQKALAKAPEERFQSAGELQAALEHHLAHSREVVSNRSVAQLMDALFPEAKFQEPALYTGREVIARLAPLTLLPLDPRQTASRRRASSRPALWRTLPWILAGATLLASLWVALEDASTRPRGTSGQARAAAAAGVSENAAARPQVHDEALHDTPAPPESRTAPRRVSPGFLVDPGF